MQITEHPRHKPFPPGMSGPEKLKYLSAGKVTVGEFARIKNNDFVPFYLPRIRGKNLILNSRKFKHPGYASADQAYSAGFVLLKKIKSDL
jgi:hypothetical protein